MRRRGAQQDRDCAAPLVGQVRLGGGRHVHPELGIGLPRLSRDHRPPPRTQPPQRGVARGASRRDEGAPRVAGDLDRQVDPVRLGEQDQPVELDATGVAVQLEAGRGEREVGELRPERAVDEHRPGHAALPQLHEAPVEARPPGARLGVDVQRPDVAPCDGEGAGGLPLGRRRRRDELVDELRGVGRVVVEGGGDPQPPLALRQGPRGHVESGGRDPGDALRAASLEAHGDAVGRVEPAQVDVGVGQLSPGGGAQADQDLLAVDRHVTHDGRGTPSGDPHPLAAVARHDDDAVGRPAARRVEGPRVLRAADDRPAPCRGSGDLGHQLVLHGIRALGEDEVGHGDAGEEARPVVADGALGPTGDVAAAHSAGPYGAALGLGADEAQLDAVQRRAGADVGNAVDVRMAVDLEGRRVPPHVPDARHQPLRAGDVVDGVGNADGSVAEVRQLDEEAHPTTDDAAAWGRAAAGGAPRRARRSGRAEMRWYARRRRGGRLATTRGRRPTRYSRKTRTSVSANSSSPSWSTSRKSGMSRVSTFRSCRRLPSTSPVRSRKLLTDETAAIRSTRLRLSARRWVIDCSAVWRCAPEVHRLLDQVDRAGQEVRRHREGDVLVVDAFGEPQPVVEEELRAGRSCSRPWCRRAARASPARAWRSGSPGPPGGAGPRAGCGRRRSAGRHR